MQNYEKNPHIIKRKLQELAVRGADGLGGGGR